MTLFLLVLIFFLCPICTDAQTHHRVSVRDSRYLQYEYTIGRHVPLMLEHSVYGEKLRLQHIRLSAGYKTDFGGSSKSLSATAYGGGVYYGNYQDFGAMITGSAAIDGHRRFWLTATLNPHYDTGLDYKFCAGTTFSAALNDHVSLLLEYTNIPEYRQSEERMRLGADIHFREIGHGSLSVRPLLSVPINERYERIRLHVNFDYCF